MVRKAREREAERRREAREGGVVLEKERRGDGKRKVGRRERGVGGPNVGKFRGGTLVLSKRDVVEIEGRKEGGRGGRGRKRGGRRT